MNQGSECPFPLYCIYCAKKIDLQPLRFTCDDCNRCEVDGCGKPLVEQVGVRVCVQHLPRWCSICHLLGKTEYTIHPTRSLENPTRLLRCANHPPPHDKCRTCNVMINRDSGVCVNCRCQQRTNAYTSLCGSYASLREDGKHRCELCEQKREKTKCSVCGHKSDSFVYEEMTTKALCGTNLNFCRDCAQCEVHGSLSFEFDQAKYDYFNCSDCSEEIKLYGRPLKNFWKKWRESIEELEEKLPTLLTKSERKKKTALLSIRKEYQCFADDKARDKRVALAFAQYKLKQKQNRSE